MLTLAKHKRTSEQTNRVEKAIRTIGTGTAKYFVVDIAFAHVGKRVGGFALCIQLVIQKFRDDSLKPCTHEEKAGPC